MSTPSSELDKFGRDYNELLSLQRSQLTTLKKLLTKEAFQNLSDFCEITNAPAQPYNRNANHYVAGGLHAVPVGSELFNFLMDSAAPEEQPQAKSIQHERNHRSHRQHR